MHLMLVPLLICSTVPAGYPAPETVGFHHAVLVYHRAERSRKDLAPYVAGIEEGTPRAWFFDAFVFLTLRAPSGRRAPDGETVREDWQAFLDDWFAQGRDLAALDAAVAGAAKVLGPPPSPRRVILGIPRPDPRVRDFGDVTGSGRSEDLTVPAGIRRVLAWYVGGAVRRFRAANYKHLDLWGFYWIRETIPAGDERLVRAAAAEVHAAGCKLLWIPWFRAPGWNRWRKLGVDTAILQPNYAFFSKHRGRIRRDRLARAAELAAHHGLGIEIELPMAVDDRRTAFYFQRYLADGAPARYGYQAGATAWYLGRDNLEHLCFSPKPWQRDLYHKAVQFVHGRAVPDPDPHPLWHVEEKEAPRLSDGRWNLPQQAVSSATAQFASPQWIGAVDIALPAVEHTRTPLSPWVGLTVVDAKPTPGAPWRTAGWAFGPGAVPPDAPWRCVTVPVRQTAAALRVRFLDNKGTRPAPPRDGVCELRIDSAPDDATLIRHRAFGCSYRIEPQPTHAQYGDSGRELTDGRVPDDGYTSGQTVGWHGRDVAITFELPRAVPIQRAEAVVEGGGAAGIHWPLDPVLLLENQKTCPPRRAAAGPLPPGLAFIPGSPVRVDRKRAPDAATGTIVFLPDSPEPAKFATVFLKADGWLMLSEIRIFADGRNIAPAAEYTLRPRPTPARGERYVDDGIRLTDGRIARRFSPPALTGWHDAPSRTVTVDLGVPQAVRRVTVWTLGGGRFGIHAPAEITVTASEDRVVWQFIGRANRPDAIDAAGRLAPVAYTADSPSPVTVRWLRLTIRSGPGWTMLSEIAVE